MFLCFLIYHYLTELIHLFLEAHTTERSNQLTHLSLCFWTPWHFSYTVATKAHRYHLQKEHVWGIFEITGKILNCRHKPCALGIHSEIWAEVLKLLTHPKATTKSSYIPHSLRIVTCNSKSSWSGCKKHSLFKSLLSMRVYSKATCGYRKR